MGGGGNKYVVWTTYLPDQKTILDSTLTCFCLVGVSGRPLSLRLCLTSLLKIPLKLLQKTPEVYRLCKLEKYFKCIWLVIRLSCWRLNVVFGSFLSIIKGAIIGSSYEIELQSWSTKSWNLGWQWMKEFLGLEIYFTKNLKNRVNDEQFQRYLEDLQTNLKRI